jgi:hypothetical protein
MAAASVAPAAASALELVVVVVLSPGVDNRRKTVESASRSSTMEFLAIVIPLWIVMSFLGGFVAVQKHRAIAEGFVMGLLFGPFGVLVEALLPNESDQGTNPAGGISRPFRRRIGLDDRGRIAYLATRYRELLDESDPTWPSQSYHMKKILMKRFDRMLMNELKLTRSQFDDLSVEAKRTILNPDAPSSAAHESTE